MPGVNSEALYGESVHWISKHCQSYKIIIITQQCFFSKRDMKVDGERSQGEWTHYGGGGMAREGSTWNDPCGDVKIISNKNLIKLLEYIELISYCNYSLDSLLPLPRSLPPFSRFYFLFETQSLFVSQPASNSLHSQG